jgi:hypothetical protein
MLLTCVSCYYPVKNKHDEKYNEWFKNTLSINCPYIFFTNKSNIEKIKKFRNNLPTYYIELEIEDFYSYKYKDRMIIDSIHCPSIELNLIWNEKMEMIKKASEINPFNSEWFHWIDAGICIYRNNEPPKTEFPNIKRIFNLPKNKMIYSSSQPYDKNKIINNNYYHCIAGTSYILHISFINKYIDIYKQYMEKLINKNNIWTDQIIHTYIYKDSPEFFYKLCEGYGEVTRYLF